MALVEAQLIMHVSERKFAQGHSLLVFATLRELEEQGLLKEHLSLDTVETCPINVLPKI
jgi:hypothetical protein